MQLDAQDFIRLVVENGSLCFWDTESTGLRGDYNSILASSHLYSNGAIENYSVVQPGNDRKIVREIKTELESADCWVTYYGKGHDIKLLNTRLLRWGYNPVEPKPHIDMYFTLKSHLNTSRRSQGHLLSWLEAPEQKMTVGAELWNTILYNPKEEMPKLVERCVSDVTGLRELFIRTCQFIRDIKR